MGQLGDQVGGLAVEVVPVGAEEARVAEVRYFTGQCRRVTVVRGDIFHFVDQAERQLGVVVQVDVQRTVVAVAGVGVVVDFAIGVVARGDETPAHPAAIIQRPAQVDFFMVGVPGAIAAFDMALEFGGRALAHHVDDAAQLAGAAEQTGRAAHDLDPVEGRQRRHGAEDTGHRGRQAVDVEFAVFVATGVDRRTTAVVGQGAQACGVLGQVIQVYELAVLDVVLGIHGDRLRNVLERSRGLGAYRGGIDAVATGLLRGQHVVEAVAFDGQGRQVERRVVRSRLACHRFSQCRQRKRRQQPQHQPSPHPSRAPHTFETAHDTPFAQLIFSRK